MKRQIVLLAGSFLLWVSPVFAADSVPSTAASAPAAPKLGGYVQARETFQDGPGLTFTVNRARLFVTGSLKQGFSYRGAIEFAAPAAGLATPSLRDAYIRWTRDWFAATAGQYKTPFSREF